MRFLAAFLFLLLFQTSFGIDSKDSEKKLLKSARKHFLYGEYDDAILKYQEAIEINPESAELYFELGLCHYENEINKEKALPFFQKSLTKSKQDTVPELLYYLAQSYQFNQEFDKAIIYYKLFDKKLNKSKDGLLLKRETTNLVNMCENGNIFLNSINNNLKIENLGGNINTDYSEYAPVINKDGNLLVFTARKKGSTGGEFYNDDKFFEDIYYSELLDTTWSAPKKLDETTKITEVKLNFVYHDAAIAFNNDETALFIYRNNDIWKAPIQNNKIGEAQPLSEVINTSEHEPSVYLTPDGNSMIMVSNKEGGFGGRDLYFSKKNTDGSWSTVKNMGDKINTAGDDDAPYISRDGKTLFFSSKGHSSMGGYDIFKSTLNDNNEWSEPENLGLPINSPGDDIFYVEDANGIGYFSSDRAGGIGSMDIYRIKPIIEKIEVDTVVASNVDTVISSISNTTTITKSITSSNFELKYDYNVFGIKDENQSYQKFISEALLIAKQNGKVIFELESSASKVPTTTYKSNHNLAKVRLNEAADKIQKDLLKLGLTMDQIQFEVFNATVQGPAYKDDFETNKSAYLPFQYVKATAK